jgi:A/G-specific adenine glycosylase
MSEASLPRESLPEIRAALLHHYDRTARDLPWRGETDPYRIWVSEVMLQQTRVETVLGYYGRWLERFPDLDSLARADVDDVLKAWEGLGYYRRARNLHRGAAVVRESQGASLPDSYTGLREIPGVGDYTAGAVASIAFGEVVPAVDGNVRRVLARLCDEADPKAAWLRRTAAALVDPDRPGDWNQALMELGATVCTPRRPKCEACPVAGWCVALSRGTQEERPRPPARKDVPSATLISVVAADAHGRVLLVRRPEEGMLAGMWSFPERRTTGGDPIGQAEDIGRRLGVQGVSGAQGVELEPVRHQFTHLHATYQPILLRGVTGGAVEESTWRLPADFGELALPVAQQKIGRQVAALLNGE